MANTDTVKITRAIALRNAITALQDNADLGETVEVLSHMLEQVEKQVTKAGGKTDARKANEQIAQALADAVPSGETITNEYITTHTIAITPQKATAVMAVAEEMGLFTRGKVGKKTAYTRV